MYEIRSTPIAEIRQNVQLCSSQQYKSSLQVRLFSRYICDAVFCPYGQQTELCLWPLQQNRRHASTKVWM
eukprot:6186172-Pleurochrysis_carterae.AAC.1